MKIWKKIETTFLWVSKAHFMNIEMKNSLVIYDLKKNKKKVLQNRLKFLWIWSTESYKIQIWKKIETTSLWVSKAHFMNLGMKNSLVIYDQKMNKKKGSSKSLKIFVDINHKKL